MTQYYDPILGETTDDPDAGAVATPEQVERTGRLHEFDAGKAFVEKIPGVKHLTSFGPADEKAQRDRAVTLDEETPAMAVAARVVPEIAIAMAGGALVEGAMAARGAVTAGRFAGAAAEGALGGALGEAERAFIADEDFSVGNMLAFGLGGELIGRLGARAVTASAGKVTNAFARSNARASKAAIEEAIESGSERSLRKMGPEVLEHARGQFDEAAEVLSAPKARYMPKADDLVDAPVQRELAARVAREALDAAVDLPTKAARAIAKQAAALTDEATQLPGFTRPEKLYEQISDLAEALPERASIREALEDAPTWGETVATKARLTREATDRAGRAPLDWKAPRADLDEALTGLEDRAKLLGDEAAPKAIAKARKALELRDVVETPSAGTVVRELVGQHLGGAAVGAAISTAYDVDPTLGAVAGFAAGGGSPYARVLRRLVDGSGATIRTAARKFARGAERVAGATAATTMPRAVDSFSADYPDEKAAYAARRDALVAAQRDPVAAATTWARSLGDFPDQHPEINTAVVARVAQSVQYLTAQMPAGIVRTLRHPNGLPPGREEIARFAAIYQAVTEPAATVRALGEGTVRPEAMRALAVVHPDLYERLQSEVLREISTAPSVPTETKIRLDSLLGLNGAATPALSREVAASIRTAEKEAPRPGGTITGTGPSNARATTSLATGPTMGGRP